MTGILNTAGQWSLRFFPEVALYRKGLYDPGAFLAAFAAIALLSVAATLIVGKISARRLMRHGHLFTVLPTLAFFFLILSAGEGTGYPPFVPVSIVLEVAAFFLALYVTGANRWIVLRMTGGLPAPLRLQMRSFLWMNLIMGSYLSIPFLLFKVPVFDRATKTFFWGAPFAMAFLYILYGRLFLARSLSLLGMELPEEEMTPGRREKLARALGGEKEKGYRVTVARQGLVNAFAFFTRRRQVIVGVELIDRLEPEELKGLLLHEEGHILDRAHFRKIRQLQTFIPFLILLFMIYIRTDLPGRGVPAVLAMLGGYAVIASLLRKVRIRAELTADRYVLEKGEDVHRAFLAGVDKLRRYNSTDPDLCKRLNAAHLDPDERERLVSGGEDALPERPRKSSAASLLWVVAFIAVITALSLMYPLYPGGKWSKAHRKYHSLMSDNDYEGAEARIRSALTTAREKFPEDDPRLYTTMNDLVRVLTYAQEYDEAFVTGIRNVAIGERIFGRGHVRTATGLVSLGMLHFYMEEYLTAGMWLEKALEVQRNGRDSAGEIINTLNWLSHALEFSDQSERAVQFLDELVELCERTPGYGMTADRARIRAAGLLGESDRERVELLLSGALFNTWQLYGPGSEAYAEILVDAGQVYAGLRDMEKAGEHFLQGLEILRSLPVLDYMDLESTLSQVAWAYREAGDTERFVAAYEEIVRLGSPGGASPDPASAYDLWMLAGGWEEMGELEKAAKYYLQAAAAGEEGGRMGAAELRELYADLIGVLERMGDRDTADRYRKKMAEAGGKR